MKRDLPVSIIKPFLSLIILICCINYLAAQNSDMNIDMYTEVEINWQQGHVVIHTFNAIKTGTLSFPKARYNAELEIEENISNLFIEAIMKLNVDSYNNIEALIKTDQDFYNRLFNISDKGKKSISSVTTDLKYIKVSYVYSFYGENGLISTLVNHQIPNPIRRILGYTTSSRFSGLLIYARGDDYKEYAKDSYSAVNPALFPKIFDENMKLVLNKEMCDPEYLKQWGMVVYTDSLDEKKFTERIGTFPLRINSRGIYGKNSTDLIISTQEANKLLYTEENHQILKQGRIVIIIDPPA